MDSLRNHIEHTALTPILTSGDIDQLVQEAKDYGMFGVCVPPFWVKQARREIGDAQITLVTVIGFPLGYQKTESKLEEINQALSDGADEIDIVMNISAFKSRMAWVKVELAKCNNLVHKSGKITKVIIETAYLSDEEIVEACQYCVDSGTDFVKTSTGFAPAGARVEHIRLMRKTLPDTVGIKASGGIRTGKEAESMLAAGADRLGVSSGVAILASE